MVGRQPVRLGDWSTSTSISTSTEPSSARISAKQIGESKAQYNQSDLEFISRKLSSVDQQIKSLDTGIKVMEQKLASLGDDKQMSQMQMQLQDAMNKQQQTLQTMSNVSKMLHDTAKAAINNVR